VQRQSISNIHVTPEELVKAFAHMVVPRETLAQLGPAVNSGKSIFLFGPPGNGKTTIAEVLVSLLKGEVVLPYAVEIDQQIIKVYDQVYHKMALDPAASDRIRFDHRWVISKRPIVMTGGELTLETLDLIYDDTSKFYEAPFQLKANGGIFMVDDFGRQRVSPKDLLNRWIVPLEKRVDYLTLHTGKKIEIPFDMLIIFSTNLDPADLVDEAFLRRIRYKIGIESPSPEQFEEIFKRMCARKQVEYRSEAMSQIMGIYRKKNLGLRSCHPRDIIEQLIDTARFLGQPPTLSPQLIEMACNSYFVTLDPSGAPKE
jgi:predicted ATPase with chaperone activity